MKVVELDLAGCATNEDVYERVLAALNAPDWHGHNLDALWDSISGGDINGMCLPYQLKVHGYGGLNKEQSELVDKIGNLFSEARRDNLTDVEFVLA